MTPIYRNDPAAVGWLAERFAARPNRPRPMSVVIAPMFSLKADNELSYGDDPCGCSTFCREDSTNTSYAQLLSLGKMTDHQIEVWLRQGYLPDGDDCYCVECYPNDDGEDGT